VEHADPRVQLGVHCHHPHENFESEHAGEAHVHDHAAPVASDENGEATRVKARKTPAKKAAKAATPGD